MSDTNFVKPRKMAMIYANSLLLSIGTASGYSRSIMDDKGEEYILPSNTDNTTLGDALLSAMAASRFVLGVPRDDVKLPDILGYDSDLYDWKKGAERYKAWTARLMEYAGLKTKTKLFKPMYSVQIEAQDGVITMQPSHQEKPEAWDGRGITEADYVKIAADSTPEQIGAAVRLAISRCTSNLAK